MKAEDILGIADINEKVSRLKKRATAEPDTVQNLKDWDPDKHDVTDEAIRKKRRIVIQPEIKDAMGTIIQEAKYKDEEVNRIPLPIEQDIVNIQTAFTMSNEPVLTSNAETEQEKDVFEVLKSILKANKIKYHNKRVMRAWLAETEVAEYWYKVEDTSWWKRVLKAFKLTAAPTMKTKVSIWSPFRGDKLYPVFDEFNNLILFSREYEVENEDDTKTTKLMVLDDTYVRYFTQSGGSWDEGSPVKHGFSKLPVVYLWREKPFCHKIKRMRSRLETLLSNYADCLDYNFFPKLAAKGEVTEVQNRGTGSEIIVLEDGADIGYLSWQQTPEMAKLEFDNLTERCYSMTNTPRISFENMKGLGSSFSGVSFEFAFMGAHMSVYNHAEDVEEFLQRRVNLLLSVIGDIIPKYKEAAESITVEVEIVPYIIKNKSQDVDLAVKAVQGGVSSRRNGILLAGITDKIEEELKEIQDEQSEPVVQ